MAKKLLVATELFMKRYDALDEQRNLLIFELRVTGENIETKKTEITDRLREYDTIVYPPSYSPA